MHSKYIIILNSYSFGKSTAEWCSCKPAKKMKYSMLKLSTRYGVPLSSSTCKNNTA